MKKLREGVCVTSNKGEGILDNVKFHGVAEKAYAKALVEKRTIKIFTGIDEDTAYTIVHYLSFLESLDDKAPITIMVSSPGGLVYVGMAIYDAIKSCKCPVQTIATGWAMSMGSIILCAGTAGLRKAYKNCTIMLHEPSGYAVGKSSTIVDEAKEITRIKDMMTDIYITNSKGKLDKKKLKKIFTRDSYMTTTEALEYGLIDEIIE